MADLTDSNTVKAITELVVGGKGLEAPPNTTGVLAGVVPPGWQQSVLDFEKFLPAPRRHSGSYNIHSVASFTDLVGVFADPTSRVYHWRQAATAGDPVTRILAVINDNGKAEAGWCDFRIHLNLERSAMWTQFTQVFNTAMEQGAFAEFMEEHAKHVVSPSGGTLLAMALNFQATRNADFAQAMRLQDGSIKLSFDDKTTPATVVPEQIVVQMVPYRQHDKAYDVTCRLRYRVSPTERRVKFTMIPLYWSDELDRMHDDVVAMIKLGVELPIIAGQPKNERPHT